MKISSILALAAVLAVNGAVFAHDDASGKASATKRSLATEERRFGREGDPKKVTRAIIVNMSDAMRFSPAQITIKRGGTVRFEVKNLGKVMHEMVLGTSQELKEHAELMKKHPGMEHDEPYMAHVAPGKTERIYWQFTKPGEFYYGCLIPGHFEAGMAGKIKVTER